MYTIKQRNQPYQHYVHHLNTLESAKRNSPDVCLLPAEMYMKPLPHTVYTQIQLDIFAAGDLSRGKLRRISVGALAIKTIQHTTKPGLKHNIVDVKNDFNIVIKIHTASQITFYSETSNVEFLQTGPTK